MMNFKLKQYVKKLILEQLEDVFKKQNKSVNLQNYDIEEGVGWGMPKDIEKDSKHTVNKMTGKNQRWTIKFNSVSDLKKHGYKRKSKDETITINEIKNIVKEILKEMWMGWEEEKEQNEIDSTSLYKYYKDLADILKDTQTGKIARKKVDQIIDNILGKKINEAKRIKFRKVYGGKPKENPLENDDFHQWIFKHESILKFAYNSLLRRTGIESIDLPFLDFAYNIYQQYKSTLNEADEIFGEKSYVIFAKSGPITVYYIDSPFQGERMVQNARSIATKFPTEEKVRHKIIQLKQKYKGLDKWDFEIISTNQGMNVWKPGGPKEFNLGHHVFKPVKRGDEYVVRWTYNGKTLPNYNYYTNDKKDALNTYRLMLKNAQELNKRGEKPQESES